MKQVSRRARGWWALCVLVLIAGACSSRDDGDEGSSGNGGGSEEGAAGISTEDCASDPTAEIEGDTIKLVSSFPQSGSAASLAEVAAGWTSHLETVNAEGGVEIAGNQYQIEWETLDDEYDPGTTATNIRELVGTDGSGAFAAFSVIGTGGNLAVREFLNDLCVPHLHAASGSPAWGNTDFPWTVGGTNPVYTLEAQVFADLLEQENPDARVAMLVQDDDFGRAYEEGLQQAIEGTDIEIVEVQRYQPGVVTDVSAQMTTLTASDADTFFDGAVGLPCLQGVQAAAEANWEREITWASSVCISKTILSQDPVAFTDSYSLGNILNPMSPEWDAEPRMQAFKDALAQYSPDTDPQSGNAAFGWNEASILVEALEAAEAPTRLAVIESYYDLDLGDDSGLIAPELGVSRSEDDRYFGERIDLVQFQIESDELFYYSPVEGDTFDFEGETTELTPESLITGGD